MRCFDSLPSNEGQTMLSNFDPAIGFVSDPIEGGGTFTLTTYLGRFLREAEALAGPRDPAWTILGVEFFGFEHDGAVPHIWFPDTCGNVAIRLTRDAATKPAKALFQLAHEACHLVSPQGKAGAPNLEEGFATLFGHRLAAKYASVTYPIEPAYRAAHDAVADLLAINPLAIRDIRVIEPRLWMITPEIVTKAIPWLNHDTAAFLCCRWGQDSS
jgi:hypothetical protein